MRVNTGRIFTGLLRLNLLFVFLLHKMLQFALSAATPNAELVRLQEPSRSNFISSPCGWVRSSLDYVHTTNKPYWSLFGTGQRPPPLKALGVVDPVSTRVLMLILHMPVWTAFMVVMVSDPAIIEPYILAVSQDTENTRSTTPQGYNTSNISHRHLSCQGQRCQGRQEHTKYSKMLYFPSGCQSLGPHHWSLIMWHKMPVFFPELHQNVSATTVSKSLWICDLSVMKTVFPFKYWTELQPTMCDYLSHSVCPSPAAVERWISSDPRLVIATWPVQFTIKALPPQKSVFLIQRCQTDLAKDTCRDAGRVWERGEGVKVGHGRSRRRRKAMTLLSCWWTHEITADFQCFNAT